MTERLAILIASPSADAPAQVVTPLVHALAARALDAEVEIHFAGPAVRWLLPAVADAAFTTPTREKTVGDFLRESLAAGVRFYACGEDLSHESPDAPLPEAVASGKEPYIVLGAIAGG